MYSPDAPLLVAEDLRLDVDDVPAVDGLTFATRTDRAIVLGAPHALLEAIRGAVRPVRGKLTVLGVPGDIANRRNLAASVAKDPPLPPKWTPAEYVTWSARLAGHRAPRASERARDVLARLGFGAASQRPLAGLPVFLRRGTVLAAALVTDASCIYVEDPLDGLPEEAARALAESFVAALEGRSWVVFASRLQLTSPFALAAREALVVSPTRLERHEAPADLARPARRFTVRMQGDADELARGLTERGASLTVSGAQALLDLGETLRTAEFLGLCERAGVTVVELLPLPSFSA